MISARDVKKTGCWEVEAWDYEMQRFYLLGVYDCAEGYDQVAALERVYEDVGGLRVTWMEKHDSEEWRRSEERLAA